jgi:hypothetical protein
MLLNNSGNCRECGDHIVSFHRHDYKQCSCGKSFVDGGLSYQRRGGSIEDTSVYSTDTFDKIREGFLWGTRGKSGREPLSFVPLKLLEKDHIENILKFPLRPEIEEIFKKELEIRKSD